MRGGFTYALLAYVSEGKLDTNLKSKMATKVDRKGNSKSGSKPDKPR